MREALARVLHEAYVRERLAAGDLMESTPSLIGWDALPEEFKQSSRRSAQDICAVVEDLGFELREGIDGGDSLEDDEIEHFAELLHERWVEERAANGWRFGALRNDRTRVHPDLVPWADLPEARREIDRHLVRSLPEFLQDVGVGLARDVLRTARSRQSRKHDR